MVGTDIFGFVWEKDRGDLCLERTKPSHFGSRARCGSPLRGSRHNIRDIRSNTITPWLRVAAFNARDLFSS